MSDKDTDDDNFKQKSGDPLKQRLIKLVREQPSLWKKSEKRNRIARNKAWKVISRKLGVSGT